MESLITDATSEKNLVREDVITTLEKLTEKEVIECKYYAKRRTYSVKEVSEKDSHINELENDENCNENCNVITSIMREKTAEGNFHNENNMQSEIDRMGTDFSDFKSYVMYEISTIKHNLQNNSSEYDWEKKSLESENVKLKMEITELRDFIKDLIGNFTDSRRNHSTETLKTNPTTNSFKEVKKSKSTKMYSKAINTDKSFTNRFSVLRISEEDSNDGDVDDVGDRLIKNNGQPQGRVMSTRRPSIVVNRHPENQTIFNNRRITSEVSSIKIVSDSIPKGIRMREFNECLNKYNDVGKTHLKAFPGTTTKQLHHYIIPTLDDEHPNTVLLHVGINDLLQGGNEIGKISKNISEIGAMCKDKGVKNVFISGLIPSRKVEEHYISNLNNQLKEICKANCYIFIDNSNITERHLWRDGIHLNDRGKDLLANNFLDIFKDFFCKDFLWTNPQTPPIR